MSARWIHARSDSDPDARYAWDHDDPMEDDDVLPVAVAENPAMVGMAEMADDDTCPF